MSSQLADPAGDVMTAEPTAALAPPGDDGRRRRRWINVVGPVFGFAVFIGFWYLMHYWLLENVFDKPRFLVTAPHRVVDESFLDADTRGDMLYALGWTALVALIGLAVAIVMGMTLAIIMAQATWIERSLLAALRS